MSELIKNGSFEIGNTKNYILSIQVCLDGFSFLITNPVENEILASKNLTVKISNNNLLARHLKEWIESEPLLKNAYKAVRLFFYSENFTLIPEEYIGKEKQRNLTSVLFDKKLSGNFIENKIGNSDINLLFPVPQDILNVLNPLYKNIEILHPVTNLIEMGTGNLSFILSSKNHFYLVVFKKGKLVLAGNFQVQHENDLIYNVINSFHQMEISRSETELYISSAIDKKTEIENLLLPYFDRINILKTEKLIAKTAVT